MSKALTDPIRDVLRLAGVPTIEQTVEAFAAALEDDAALLRAFGSPDASDGE